MARAIVRLSLDNDYGSANTNLARLILEDAGFEKTGTATYEADAPGTDDLLIALQKIVAVLQNLSGGVSLDHLWIYVDVPQPSPPLAAPKGWQDKIP